MDDLTEHLFKGGGRRESRAHAEAKLLVASMTRGGSLIVSAEIEHRYRSFYFETVAMTTVVECAYPSGEQVLDSSRYYARHGHYPEMILDVGLVYKGSIVAAVEVIRNHGLNERKRRKIANAGLLCICVKAAHWEWRIDDRRLDACEILPQAPGGHQWLEPMKAYAPEPIVSSRT